MEQQCESPQLGHHPCKLRVMEKLDDYRCNVSAPVPSHYSGNHLSAFSPSDSSGLVSSGIATSPPAENGNGVSNGRQCGTCQQTFHRRADLQTHIERVHQGVVIKPYKCQTCGKSFANSSYLTQHSRIHLGLKPYHCQICNRRFTQLSHQQQHMRTHTGERPYTCHQTGCNKAFSQLSNLQSHMRSHMTDRPFRCHSCYKCFGDEAALRDHIPHHTETKHLKTKICTVCGKSYAQDTYLARHMARHQAAAAAGGTVSGGGGNLEPPQNAGQVHHEHRREDTTPSVGAFRQSLPSFNHQINGGSDIQVPFYRFMGDVNHAIPQPYFHQGNNALSGLFSRGYGNDC